MGGKFKLLDKIVPLFPQNIETFVDLFGGGFNVGINVAAKHIIYNDIESHVCKLLEYFSITDTEQLLSEIHDLIERFKLSKENAEGFNSLREYYNKENSSPIVFYTVLCYAFNYQIRFNSSGKYNMPFGKNRSSFNSALEQKFIKFVDVLHSKSCTFYNFTFEKFDLSALGANNFVYCDPPYYNSTATYNEQGGWTQEHEKTLLKKLDELNNNNVKFALSNNLKYDNPFLSEWKDKYVVHYIDGDYSNCNYHKIDRSKDVEVVITNY